MSQLKGASFRTSEMEWGSSLALLLTSSTLLGPWERGEGRPHLQTGQVHVLYDTARAGQDLLLQEQAAQLQRGQSDLPICRTQQVSLASPGAVPWNTGSGLPAVRLTGLTVDQSRSYPVETQREPHMPTPFLVNYNSTFPTKLRIHHVII